MQKQFTQSLYHGFIDRERFRKAKYRPKLLTNNHKKKTNVLTTLLEQLETSQAFFFAVAFITESGLASLKAKLHDLNQKGVKGKILTSTFLQFNKPKVFKELLKLSNVEVRIANVEGFHSKGYIFEHKDYYSLIVGSSNLTASALKQNKEWNVQLNSLENGDIIHHFLQQFTSMWEEAVPLTEAWIETYENQYQSPFTEKKIADFSHEYIVNRLEDSLSLQPNKMQKAALHNLKQIRKQGAERSLIVSATGTGKTYLSAFDVRHFQPKRMLFIAHREQILQQAKEDYHRVLGGVAKDFGILSGNVKDLDRKYLFATIQTISKPEILESFHPKEFDYIVIDEVHKAGAMSYQRVIDYFQPNFLLGMTATPERTDQFNIYELFDYQIAYEIRLQEALEEEMLCPFHYFGVTDFEHNGEVISDTSRLSQLVTKERVDHIIEKIRYYGFSGEQLKGLMFCSRKQEARLLSEELNRRGFRTVALSGEDSQEERERQIKRLENGSLDYILTVDIFNEGVDIPSVNQIVMLRQTESSIVFIQQLGRGLRKHESKEFLTVIDFIGNYKNNYLIPIALTGDRSQNKDSIRRRTKEMTYIQGVSTINFEEVARKRIFASITQTNLTTLKILRESYQELEDKLGRIPSLYDFIRYHSIDPEVIVQKHQNYYLFLKRIGKQVPLLSEYESAVLTMLSAEILNGKRKHEVIFFHQLLENDTIEKEQLLSLLKEEGCYAEDEILDSLERVFTLEFFNDQTKKKYGNLPLIDIEEGNFSLSSKLRQHLRNCPSFEAYVKDIITCAFAKSNDYDSTYPLTLYKKYTRKEVCKLLNWEKDESSTIYGYRVKHGTCPIFITYHKDDRIESSIKYEDELLQEDLLRWFTKPNRTLQSPEVKQIIEAEQNGIELHVFIKKNDDEGVDFYYLGKAVPLQERIKELEKVNEKGKKQPIVEMELLLEQPVEHQLYQYLHFE